MSCDENAEKDDTSFVAGTIDGVTSIGNDNSNAPTDLVVDRSGKINAKLIGNE